jgi:hypothetical protein
VREGDAERSLDYFVGEDHLVEKQPAFVLQSLIYGATVAKNHWLYREAMRPVKEFANNPLAPDVVMEHVREQKLVMDDRPSFEPWDIYKCFWEPGARDVDSAAYVVLQSYISKDDLLQQRVEPADGNGDLPQRRPTAGVGCGTGAAAVGAVRNLGLQGERYKDKFLIEEIWTDDQLVGDRERPGAFAAAAEPVLARQEADRDRPDPP